jgi:Mg2+ and Co2+ transporter CorA
LQTVILYNEHEVRQGGNKEDIRRGYNLWIDIADPSPTEILAIQKNFDLDTKTLETFIHKSKKPQVRVLDSYTFTLILDLKYKSFGTLVTEASFHQAVADVLGLHITDHKCLDLLRRFGAMPAGRLGELTGLTTGAVTR